MGSGASLGTPPRDHSLVALSSSTGGERQPGGALLLGKCDFYASVIAVEYATRPRDKQVAKPPLMRTKAMHLKSRSLCICHSGRMHHQYLRRTGGEGAP